VKAVLDTNAVIYLHNGLLAENLPVGEYAISVIVGSRMIVYQAVAIPCSKPKRFRGCSPERKVGAVRREPKDR